MSLKEGLRNSVNEIRDMSSSLYQRRVPFIEEDSAIENLSTPLLSMPKLMNEFIDVLVQRVVYTQYERKIFKNPLKILEGDNLPLGYIGQEIFINPAKGRNYDVNDFAGILKKYEADVKVQYPTINFDKQYPVTVIREKLKQAFVSWDSLEEFIGGFTDSLYNGAYIDEYRATKQLVSNAYKTNSVQIRKVNGITSEALAKEFITMVRSLFLNFQAPSVEYNAWRKVGGYGRDIITFCEKNDIVFIIRNDIQAYLDVNIMASAFNITSTELMGRIITVDNFDEFDNKGNKIYDGSKILGIMADKSWFRIKTQDMYMEDFRNPNNRSLQYYLNLIKMFQYSFFANAVVFSTEEPEINITSLDFKAPEGVEIIKGEQEGLDITVLPNTANTPKITYSVDSENICTVEETEGNDRHCKVTALLEGEATLTATAGDVSATVTIKVVSSS